MTAQISLLATGGTISTRPRASGSVPVHGAEDLAASLGDLSGTTLRPRDVSKVPSHAVTAADMWDLAAEVDAEIRAGADGVVVTHGTDTLEETAYALALLVETRVPVVLTGAMRPPHVNGPDGLANLGAAVSAASCPALAAYGPVVVIHDEIHVARWVTKQHSSRVAAFESPSAGPVGVLVEGEVELLLGPAPGSDRLPVVGPPDGVRVELLWTAAGADGFVVDAVADGVDGVVVAGTGGGHAPPALADALIRLVEAGRPVVLASRCGGAGRVLQRTYGGDGSEKHLLSRGLVPAGSLPPLKARLRLLFGLSAGLSASELFPV
jgi:L-asparaginase